MIKKKWIIPIIVSLALSLASGCGKTEKNELGTGGIGGTYYQYGTELSKAVAKDNSKINLTVQKTAGSAANIRLMDGGFINFAIVQSDVLESAAKGTDMFDQKPVKGISAIAGLYDEYCQIVTKADSGIETVKDLAGKRVSLGETDSGVVYQAEQILSLNGVSLNKIEVHNNSFKESAELLLEDKIDAFFCTAGIPTEFLTELCKENEIRFLSLDEKTIDSMISLYDYYVEEEIPAGTYEGVDETIRTIGVKAVLVAGSGVSDEVVTAVTNSLFGCENEYNYSDNNSGLLDPSWATSNIPVTFHPGAASWYKEKGIEVEADKEGKVIHGISAGQD